MSTKKLKTGGGFNLGDDLPDPAEVQKFMDGAVTRHTPPNPTTPHPTAPHHTQPYPWTEANPRIVKQYNVKLDEPLHAKLAWLSDHGRGSIARIMMVGIRAEAERLLRLHGVKDD
jgi:hypothetical protein